MWPASTKLAGEMFLRAQCWHADVHVLLCCAVAARWQRSSAVATSEASMLLVNRGLANRAAQLLHPLAIYIKCFELR